MIRWLEIQLVLTCLYNHLLNNSVTSILLVCFRSNAYIIISSQLRQNVATSERGKLKDTFCSIEKTNNFVAISDSENSDLVYKSCGLLVNITKYKEFHEKLPSKIVSLHNLKPILFVAMAIWCLVIEKR